MKIHSIDFLPNSSGLITLCGTFAIGKPSRRLFSRITTTVTRKMMTIVVSFDQILEEKNFVLVISVIHPKLFTTDRRVYRINYFVADKQVKK